MARILSIDYGAKRTGIAVTDSLQIIASPLKGMATSGLLTYVSEYVKQEDVELIIIGYPTHKDGNPTYLCKEIDRFIKQLKKDIQIPIEKVDETNTSSDASVLLATSHMKKKDRMKKENLDMFSALVILRRYLRHDF